MDTQTGPAGAAVTAQLFAHGERFGYFQAVRLLRLLARSEGRDADVLRVRPHLGLGFPETDIERIERVEAPQLDADATSPEDRPHAPVVRITANFFGLYGVASPLPTFYTEDLLDEQREGRQATRNFLDIFHYALYPLLYQAWSKFRLQLRVTEEHDHRVLDYLYAFVGLEERQLRRDDQPGMGDLLRYAGIISQRPHTALGLQTMLTDAFRPGTVNIESCAATWTPIPPDQRLKLGDRQRRLGEDTHLGTRISERMNHIRLRLTELPVKLFHQLLPGEVQHERLRFLTRFYLINPMGVTVELRLKPGAAQPAQLGTDRWSRLGLNTWLAPDPSRAPPGVRFHI